MYKVFLDSISHISSLCLSCSEDYKQECYFQFPNQKINPKMSCSNKRTPVPSSGWQCVLNVPLLAAGVVLIVETAGSSLCMVPSWAVRIRASTEWSLFESPYARWSMRGFLIQNQNQALVLAWIKKCTGNSR